MSFLEKHENDEMESSMKNFDVNIRRKKKFTGGNASKRHRDRVNVEFSNLAKLLPFPESVIAKLDKSSILRLAVSYIRAKSFFKDVPKRKLIKQEQESTFVGEGSGMVTDMFSQALDGFLLVLTEDMKVLFVSESVRDYLGYCQAGIIHETFLQFVNPSDHAIVQSNIQYKKEEIYRTEDGSTKQNEPKTLYKDPSTSYEDEILSNTNTRGNNIGATVSRQFVCRMKCAYSCSSRFYTAYRTFQFNGHLRKSNIQEGRKQKVFNTLVVFATPVSGNVNEKKSAPECPIKKEWPAYQHHSVEHTELNSYDRYSSPGFRIEPTLRPHVAPIPVSTKEPSSEASLFSSSKPLPSLICTSESLPYEVPRLISRESVCSSHLKPSSVETCSSLDGCSDNSDDSKCSPVSSPNLLWKQRTSNSLLNLYNERTTDVYHNNEHVAAPNQKSAHSDYHYKTMRSSLNFYEMERNSCKTLPANIDVYMGANMLINMRQRKTCSPARRTHSPDTTSECCKRRYEYSPYEKDGYKHKETREPRTSKNFNISSLLGLDRENPNASERRSAFTELIKKSYIAAGTSYTC